MLRFFRPKLINLAFALILLTACAENPTSIAHQVTTPTLTIQTNSNTTNTPSPTKATPTSAPTPTSVTPTTTTPPTKTPTPTITLSPLATDIQTPTAVSTAVPAQSPLLVRKPTIQQLRDYLFSTYLEYHHPTEGAKLLRLAEPTSGSLNIYENSEMLYHDVNGDGFEDLVLHHVGNSNWGIQYLFILLWEDGRYQNTFLTSDVSKYRAGSHISFADWTGDGVNEAVWNYHISEGGSGAYTRYYNQSIIHCEDRCSIIWHENLHTTSDGWSDERYRKRETSEVILSDDFKEITVRRSHFLIPMIQPNETTPFEVFPDTETVYRWDKFRFEQVSSTELTDSSSIDSTSQLIASTNTDTASLKASFYAGNSAEEPFTNGYDCALEVNGDQLGELFNCSPQFTTVEWLDVTGDSELELVVTSLFEGFQRIQIWEEVSWGFQPIADVQGEVISRNLYGVRLENVDDDISLEILAARWDYNTGEQCFDLCWIEVTKDSIIYDWNGSKFVEISAES